jgi:UDP:flavonoid glycosyltransferase YjiC (YdhE family)
VLIGPWADAVDMKRLDVTQAPDLLAIVAERSITAKRDLTKHTCERHHLRRGRIGLMDPSQWALDGQGSPVECFGSMPFLAYATPNARSAPRPLLEAGDFHEFRAGEISLSRFLEKIDLLTYFPGDAPSDTMIIPLLRAVQAGVLVLADRRLREQLGPFVLYCEPHEVEQTVARLVNHPDHAVRTALSNARALALARCHEKAVRLVEALSDIAAETSRVGSVARFPCQAQRAEILFVSSNGVGLGHLTRLMAIARRLRRADPVFVTMSQAFAVVQASGWPVKYLPFHTVSGCDVAHWNQWLKYELELLLHHRPRIRTLVFDGSNPYSGLLAACGGSELRKVWVQRGMWKKGQMSIEHVRRGKNFDLIIEPADLAESLATEQVESAVFDKVRTDPILLLDRNELLCPEEARAALSIPEDHRACLIQLGSGTNRDIVSLLNIIIPELLSRGLTPYIAEWLMGSEIPRIWSEAVYLRVFPLSKYYNAFDFSIAAAGYNSFHEIIGFGLPTIFIANEHQMMDDQAGRASHAMTHDAAFWIVEEAVQEIGTAVDLILRDEVRDLIKSNCLALSRRNGAQDAASIIEQLALETVGPVAAGNPAPFSHFEQQAI